MIIAPYKDGEAHDEILTKISSGIQNNIITKDDDYLMLLVGDTGTGKSTLALHVHDIVIPSDDTSPSRVAFSLDDFAESLKSVSERSQPRFLWYDEANIQKRDSLTRANKRLIDLYFSIRGLNIFHVWCNPSLDVIDKVFIKERIKSVVFVKGKTVTHPRYYFFFRTRDILKIMEKYSKLDLKLLDRVKGKYSYFRGWFRDNKGPFKKEYDNKKQARMEHKVVEFFQEFSKNGNSLLSIGKVAKAAGIGTDIIRKHVRSGILKEEEHFVYTLGGQRRFKPNVFEALKGVAKKPNWERDE